MMTTGRVGSVLMWRQVKPPSRWPSAAGPLKDSPWSRAGEAEGNRKEASFKFIGFSAFIGFLFF